MVVLLLAASMGALAMITGLPLALFGGVSHWRISQDGEDEDTSSRRRAATASLVVGIVIVVLGALPSLGLLLLLALFSASTV